MDEIVSQVAILAIVLQQHAAVIGLVTALAFAADPCVDQPQQAGIVF
jgi:hypothetical protein